MLFGSTDSFAIEAMIEPKLLQPSAVWGRMRVWFEGRPFGDYSEEHCALYPAYASFKELDEKLDTLWHPSFDGLTDAEIYDLLDGLLFGWNGTVELDDNRSLAQCQADAKIFGRFSFLTNWGEQFDQSGKSFIICPSNGVAKLLNRSAPEGAVEALVVSSTDIHYSIGEFGCWYEQENTRLSSGHVA